MMNYSGRHDKFDEYLDELYPMVEVAGVSMLPSNVLFFTDRIAYDVLLSDWEPEQKEEDEEPDVCSAEDAWDSMTADEKLVFDRDDYIRVYNIENNL